MKILKTLIQRADDGELLEADTTEYEGRLWIVPEWLAGPTKGTEMPARIICLDNLQTAKPGPRYWADLVLSIPLSKDFLEGRALIQGVRRDREAGYIPARGYGFSLLGAFHRESKARLICRAFSLKWSILYRLRSRRRRRINLPASPFMGSGAPSPQREQERQM
jgi:hypothetical protein